MCVYVFEQPEHETGSKGYFPNGLSQYTRQASAGTKAAFLNRVVNFLVAVDERRQIADLKRLGRRE